MFKKKKKSFPLEHEMQVNCSFCFLPPGDAVSMAFLSSFIEVAERLAGKQAVFWGGGGYVSTVYFSRRQNRDLYLNRRVFGWQYHVSYDSYYCALQFV